MIERERTYLAKSIPPEILAGPSKRVVDLYIDNGTDHADLRLRQNGDQYELTRKVPTVAGDASTQKETTIGLSRVEFESLSHAQGKRIEKIRYCYTYRGVRTECDVFGGALTGLVLIDFEFDSEEEKNAFVLPDFCLAEVTQEQFIAGGVLAGKTYADIEHELVRFAYQKILL